MPILFCLNIIGPFEESLIPIAAKIIIGKVKIISIEDTKISKTLFANALIMLSSGIVLVLIIGNVPIIST